MPSGACLTFRNSLGIQLVCLTVAPAFIAGGIYLTLKHMWDTIHTSSYHLPNRVWKQYEAENHFSRVCFLQIPRYWCQAVSSSMELGSLALIPNGILGYSSSAISCRFLFKRKHTLYYLSLRACSLDLHREIKLIFASGPERQWQPKAPRKSPQVTISWCSA